MATPGKWILYTFYTGLVAGTLDLAGAITSYLIVHGRFPYHILEYIASGAFGKSAMDGTTASNTWGLLFHYFIAMSFTFFYFIIYRGTRILHKSMIGSAIIYGLFVWAVTNMIVLPLSALHAPVIPPDLIAAARAAFVLIICIGIPVTWAARKFYTN